MEQYQWFREAQVVSWDPEVGSGFCRIIEAEYPVSFWALVPVPQKGRDMTGALLKDVYVDPEHPSALATVVCATVRGEPLPEILDVSEIIVSQSGGNLLPRPSNSLQIVCAGALARLLPGTPVAVTGYQEEPRRRLAFGHTLLNRLVVKAWRRHGSRQPWQGLIVGLGKVYYPLLNIPREAIEVQTMIGQYKGQLRYLLIRRERENPVRNAMTWEAFVEIVREELHLEAVFNAAPETVYDDDLVAEWRWWHYRFEPRCACEEWDFAELSPDEIIAELQRRHLIPMVNYARMIKRGEYGEQKPRTFWKLLRKQHRATACAQIGPDICAHRVLEYLLSTESQFPQPDNGLRRLGTPEQVTAALRWARWTPASRELIRRLKDLARQYEGRVVIPSVRELAGMYLLRKRPPKVKDFLDLVALEEAYPLWVNIPDVGEVPVTYERVPGLSVTLARVRLNPAQVMVASEPVEGLPEGVTLAVESLYGMGNLEAVRQATRWALMRELFEKTTAELPAKRVFWVDKGNNLLPGDPAPEQIAMFQATRIVVIPAHFEVTDWGIEAVGWVWDQDIEAMEAALASLKHVCEVWRCKRAVAAP